MFGLVGAHRSGKTTLAKAVAEGMNIPFVESSVSARLRAEGMDPVAPMTPLERIVLQERLLDLYLETIVAAPRPAITDRTPLDMAAYTLAEFGMHTGGLLGGNAQEIGHRVTTYVSRCLSETHKHFGMVFLVPPLPHYEEAEGKPPVDVGYQTHIHMLCLGLITHLNQAGHTIAFLNTQDLGERVGFASKAIQNELKEYAAARSRLLFN